MGDNRDNNNDSRKYGPMQVPSVVGQAKLIWWSQAPDRGLRWNRFGLRLDRAPIAAPSAHGVPGCGGMRSVSVNLRPTAVPGGHSCAAIGRLTMTGSP